MSAPAEVLVALPAAPPASSALQSFDRALRWAGDHLNPILVKEARQALKSKQFLITFLALLSCAWIATFVGMAMIGPDIYYTAQGADLFMVYFFFLTFAMFVIVPFGAFRSLATEQEDRTFSLLAITTLNPRQIVSGKLGSAVLQMLIYLSSITPCLAFTYLLRGIDLPSILLILLYTVLGSFGLSVIALLLATVTSEKHWQVVLSVVLILALLLGWYLGMVGAVVVLSEMDGMFGWNEFWVANAGIVSIYAGYFALFFFAAAAQLTFSTDNRSTRLRVVMLVQQVLFTGWIAWLALTMAPHDMDEMAAVYLGCLGVHWYLMGALLTGESPELSPRVRRNLPQSFLGRAFLTWFNPGPGTGYVFALANAAAAVMLCLVALSVLEWWRLLPTMGPRISLDILGAIGVVIVGYLAFYLGLGLLLTRVLRRVTHVPMFLTLLFQVLLFVLLGFVPWIVGAITFGPGGVSYGVWHITNPFWTLAEIGRNWNGSLSADAIMAVIGVTLMAVIVFCANLFWIAREVSWVRIERPQRVAEEDTALALAKSPPKPVKLSPWD